MKEINVEIKQKNINYKILFLDNIFSILKSKNDKKLLFVIDSQVYKLYFNSLFSEQSKQINAEILVIPNGEKNKNMKTVFMILDKLLEFSFTRKDYLVSIGGGVTGDICGFASSLFKRGINFIQIPTTLLSMFDSSVGGKTGVDYNLIKNGIGTFYNPELVLIDINFLKTLEKKELIGGYFEGLKHSILSGKQDYVEFKNIYEDIINKNFAENIQEIIAKNIKCKLDVVKSDPTETNGKRKILNYGHTFGHALETHLNFKLGHGICVAFGIIYANLLSFNLGFLDKKVYENIEKFIKSKLEFVNLGELNFEEIYNFMKNDKKNETSEVNFILLKDYSRVFEKKVKKEKLKEIFEKMFKIVN